MNVGNWNFTIQQGSTFNQLMQFTDLDGNVINITGYTVTITCQTFKGSGVTLFTWAASSGITVTGTQGLVEIDIDEAVTAAYAFSIGYQTTEMTDGTDTFRIMQGNVYLDKE